MKYASCRDSRWCRLAVLRLQVGCSVNQCALEASLTYLLTQFQLYVSFVSGLRECPLEIVNKHKVQNGIKITEFSYATQKNFCYCCRRICGWCT